ncbi:hypothetical protein O6H91_16G084000 [Diphasiastrum complanatum]|uniref:Uncharacterized protein n=1 Tax=Diphasiastrum complanatum TaxID=34168 RepID=A0ACC2BE67_DIPCM|nr:hypothetical protein O6H91_16G084000 [Diphasiastrum complanatum]
MGETDAHAAMKNGAVPGSSLISGFDSPRHGEFARGAPLLRVVGLVFSLIALVLIATNKETESIPVSLPGMSKPLYLTKSASFVDIKALKFYLGSLAIVAAYLFFQGIFSAVNLLTTKSVIRSKAEAWFTFIADQTFAYLLVSAAAVATEIGYLAKHGATKVGWNEVCTQFNHFCTVYGVSVINAYLAALAIFASAAISAYHLFRHYGPVLHDYETRKQLL